VHTSTPVHAPVPLLYFGAEKKTKGRRHVVMAAASESFGQPYDVIAADARQSVYAVAPPGGRP
jgi:hypothetical protein